MHGVEGRFLLAGSLHSHVLAKGGTTATKALCSKNQRSNRVGKGDEQKPERSLRQPCRKTLLQDVAAHLNHHSESSSQAPLGLVAKLRSVTSIPVSV